MSLVGVLSRGIFMIMKRTVFLLVLCCSFGFLSAMEDFDSGAAAACAAAPEVEQLPILLSTMSEESFEGLEQLRAVNPETIEDEEQRMKFNSAIVFWYFMERPEVGLVALQNLESYVLHPEVNAEGWMASMKKKIDIVLNPTFSIDISIDLFAKMFGNKEDLFILKLLSGRIDYSKALPEKPFSEFFQLSQWHAVILPISKCRKETRKDKRLIREMLSFLADNNPCPSYCDGAGKTAFYIFCLLNQRDWLAFLKNRYHEFYGRLYSARCEDGRDGFVIISEKEQEFRALSVRSSMQEPASPSRKERQRQSIQRKKLERRSQREESRCMGMEDAWLPKRKEHKVYVGAAAAAAAAPSVDAASCPEVEPELSPKPERCRICFRNIKPGCEPMALLCPKCSNEKSAHVSCWRKRYKQVAAAWVSCLSDGCDGKFVGSY
jgi:hypothetical protein